ncbi:SusC/RagA family TonB-linked outer membrane protein [Mucilaginibacter sp. L196]|uniref:SusC/RagA family TonB-linked outer membrane protein n=1 Tax=Mucilaginibacter sp. L196 TaxID=1641870 RepID=UPI0020B119E5|nr:SusC/RagA family TonB-linked outer membrane protein [Mucilaginibacter sp. L196]
MKLITVLLFAIIMQVSATGFAQKVTLKGDNISLMQLFKEIRKQTGYGVLYQSDKVNTTIVIKADFKNAPLDQVLNESLKGQALTYTIDEKIIVIKEKEILLQGKPALTPVVKDTTFSIKGHVVDENGKPLYGASVMIKGTKIGHVTNMDGSFYISNVHQGMSIQISFIGYLTKVVKAVPDLENIVLEVSSNELDETHVIGYGRESRRFSVGSTANVTAADIEKQPVTNVLQALEGQVAGLTVTPTSGEPGVTTQVQVRGQNSIGVDVFGSKFYDQPLIIIDGVPIASQNLNVNTIQPFFTTFGANAYTGFSAMNNINPDDIESISVLKDADATSIYGTQGANGVILVTTKKGKAGKTTMNVSVNTGYNTDARPVQFLNTPQYLQYRNDAFKSDGLTPSNNANLQTYAPDLTVFDQNKYTNWFNTFFGKTSNQTDAHVSLSGGSVNNTFLISGGYTGSDYNYPGNFADKRLTYHSSYHHQSQDNRLTIDFGTDYSYDHNNHFNNSNALPALNPPNLPDLLDAAGNLVWSYKGADLTFYQAYAYLKQPVDLQNYNLKNSLNISYKLAPGLSMSANMGYSRVDVNESEEFPSNSQTPDYPSYPGSSFVNSTYQTINIEPQLDYSHTIGKGEFSALLGSTYKKNVQSSNSQDGYGYTSDAQLGSIDGASTVYDNDNSSIYKYSAVFGRVKYIYDQEYIISLTGRRDGSSNFGPGRQFGNFGSAGLGWIFSEEKSFKDALPFVSYAKISGNYGTSGSDGIAPYQFQSFYAAVTYPIAPPFQGVKPISPQNLNNPDYSWATKKSLDLGLDLGFLKDQLLMNITYYRNREGNQLLNYPLASQAGFTSVLENLDATVQNTGWEFTINSKNIATKNFKWTSSFNISANRNKLVSFPGLANSSYASDYAIGKSTSTVFVVKYKDVNPTTGLFEFYGANGQVTSNPDYYDSAAQGGDRVSTVDLQPKFYGGLGNNFSYKRLTLSVFFQFSKQTAPNYLYTLYSLNLIQSGLFNVPTQVMNNYWRNPGDHTQLQRLTATYSDPVITAGQAFTYSSGAYSDDTYLRLKTLSLSYALPGVFLKKLNLTNFRIYANVQNLLTFTDYKVGDPELPGGYANYSLQRTLVFGLSFNL